MRNRRGALVGPPFHGLFMLNDTRSISRFDLDERMRCEIYAVAYAAYRIGNSSTSISREITVKRKRNSSSVCIGRSVLQVSFNCEKLKL